MSYVLASNSNAQILGGEIACHGLAEYTAGYCAKNPTQVGAVLSVVRHIMQETEDILGKPPFVVLRPWQLVQSLPSLFPGLSVPSPDLQEAIEVDVDDCVQEPTPVEGFLGD